MTVLEVIHGYHLEQAKKSYKDVYGQIYPFITLDILKNLTVKDFYLNLMTNEAIITVIES